MKIKKWSTDLVAGDVLATGDVVVSIKEMGGQTVITLDNNVVFIFNDVVSVELMEETNCLYGGLAVGHTAGFCTADACY